MEEKRRRSRRGLRVNVPSDAPKYDDVGEGSEELESGDGDQPSLSNGNGYEGDYLDLPSHPRLSKLLHKQGDSKVLFADKVMKFTGTGKMKRRILLITSLALYMVDPDNASLKRRVALINIDKISFSDLRDNFLAIGIPTEYDLLIASTRKTEMITILVEAVKVASGNAPEVETSNSYKYHAAADSEKEVRFEEVEGGVRTRILKT